MLLLFDFINFVGRTVMVTVMVLILNIWLNIRFVYLFKVPIIRTVSQSYLKQISYHIKDLLKVYSTWRSTGAIEKYSKKLLQCVMQRT